MEGSLPFPLISFMNIDVISPCLAFHFWLFFERREDEKESFADNVGDSNTSKLRTTCDANGSVMR